MATNNKLVETRTIESLLKTVIRDLIDTGYGHLIDQFPLVTDDGMSTINSRDLDAHQTFSFADTNSVHFSEKRCAEQLDNYYREKGMKTPVPWHKLYVTVRDVIEHEYNHILLGHVFEKHPRDKEDCEALIMTHEIEANRGVNYDLSDYFADACVSDNSPLFRTTKTLITRSAIFTEVKRILKQINPSRNSKPEEQEQDGQQGNQQNGQQNNTQDNDKDRSPQTSNQRGLNKQQLEQLERYMNNIETMKDKSYRDSYDKDDGEDGEQSGTDKLFSELGLTKDENYDNSTDKKIRLFNKAFYNREIRRALQRIKGELKGDLNKHKVGTYSRSSRKASDDGLMKRGSKKIKNSRPNILIALDESGSMNTTAVKTAAVAVRAIAKTLGRDCDNIEICSFSNEINRYATLSNADKVINNYDPDGGTFFDVVVERAIQDGVDTVICIGDGEGCLPDEDWLNRNGIYQRSKNPDKYKNNKIKWIDALITSSNSSINAVKRVYYTEDDKRYNRRETYWLGNDSKLINDLIDGV